jgi:hypothetical protein
MSVKTIIIPYGIMRGLFLSGAPTNKIGLINRLGVLNAIRKNNR